MCNKNSSKLHVHACETKCQIENCSSVQVYPLIILLELHMYNCVAAQHCLKSIKYGHNQLIGVICIHVMMVTLLDL